MRFYEVNSNDIEENEGSLYFATKQQAVRFARETADNGEAATVYLVEIPDTRKETIINLANGRGWCSHRERILHLEAKL